MIDGTGTPCPPLSQGVTLGFRALSSDHDPLSALRTSIRGTRLRVPTPNPQRHTDIEMDSQEENSPKVREGQGGTASAWELSWPFPPGGGLSNPVTYRLGIQSFDPGRVTEQMLSNQILQGAEGTVGLGGVTGAILTPSTASPDCSPPPPPRPKQLVPTHSLQWSPPSRSSSSASTCPHPFVTLPSRSRGTQSPAGTCPRRVSCASLAHPKPAAQHRSEEAVFPPGLC